MLRLGILAKFLSSTSLASAGETASSAIGRIATTSQSDDARQNGAAQLRRRGLLARLFGWQPATKDELRETAWLDGVRGLASFLVMLNHYNLEWLSKYAAAPYGAIVKENEYVDGVWQFEKDQVLKDFWRLPFLQLLICSGGAQVCVFFILSGFVLSWGPLKIIRRGDYAHFARTIGSATFRRWMRLYLPCLIVSCIYLVRRLITGDQQGHSTVAMILDFLEASETWANPFTLDRKSAFMANNRYNFVMWTIPFEFSGSLMVFGLLFTIAALPSYRRRMAIYAGISLYAVVSCYWGYWLFAFGLGLAEYVMHSGGFEKLSRQPTLLSSTAWTVVFLLGLFILGMPPHSQSYIRTGYEWMTDVPLPKEFGGQVTEGRFWWGWGAMCLITSSCHLPIVRRFFESSVLQHLGRISFMLYLIHWLIVDAIGNPLRLKLYETLALKVDNERFDNKMQYITPSFMHMIIFGILWLVCAPISLVLAHWLEVSVDRPCTRFSKWVHVKISEDSSATAPVDGKEEREMLLQAELADIESARHEP